MKKKNNETNEETFKIYIDKHIQFIWIHQSENVLSIVDIVGSYTIHKR